MNGRVDGRRGFGPRWMLGLLAALWLWPATAQNYFPQVGQQNQRPGQGQDGQNDNQNQRTGAGVPAIDPTGNSGPVGPVTIGQDSSFVFDRGGLPTTRGGSGAALSIATAKLPPPSTLGEFELYVERSIGRRLPRFGSNLLLPEARDFAVPATATVPPQYVLGVGDIVSVQLSGSIEGDVEKQIDADGNVFIPRVGSVHVAGVRYADLRARIAAAVGKQFRSFTTNVSVRQLRGIRVYVTGFANDPGAYTVNSLTTLVNAVLSAGGPSSGGSYRSVKLYRRGVEVADFDLYGLVRGGSRTNDAVLQNEDVLFIGPVGAQVAVVGSVGEEAIYEAKPGESLGTLVDLAGGANVLADGSRLVLYRLGNLDRVGAVEVSRAAAGSTLAVGGDIIQIVSQGTLQRPIERQSVLVRLEGEVSKPGNYFVPAGTSLGDVVARAGGLTPRAFVYGTRLVRQSVRAQQRQGFLDAVDQLDVSLAAAPLTSSGVGDAAERTAQVASARAVLDRLRRAEPDGRVVLDVPADAAALPAALVLENNDTVLVPPRPTTVGVFGAVYRPSSFLFDEARPLRVVDYLERAGGPIRVGDKGQIFVVRANGEVLPRRRGALTARVLPGDVVFVPVRTSSNSLFAKIRDIAQVLFQFGLSAAVVTAATR